MDIMVVQSYRFPNVFTARPEYDGEQIEQCFVDKLDPAGSFAAEALMRWAEEHGHTIKSVRLQTRFAQVPYGFPVEPVVIN
jgi:hypothetical protein